MTYLSFVTVSRNDDYGGNLQHRMQCCIDSVIKFSERHELDSELILVEWNPPTDQDRLADALDWPVETNHIDVRIITVPPETHDEVTEGKGGPVREYIGKNAGIRRARGDYVVATNPDNLFGEDLINHLATEPLRDDQFYRTNRCNLDSLVPRNEDVDTQLTFAKNHVELVSKNNGSEWKGTVPERLYHRYRQYRERPGQLWSVIRRIVGGRVRSVYDLHCDNSGDFILLSKKQWKAMRGHPETDIDIHMDSYTVLIAAAMGLEQVVFSEPWCIYHQPHDRHERPDDGWDEFVSRGKEWLATNDPEINNGPDWGLNEYDLPDEKIA